ncbi:hypothetical protein HWV62_18268 [Athelia sp. TMB]|nr:hypothetical protein HWV62_28904 [Athelia sp. TMB]KAF7983901.1 hypothetical protein HWV62_18268 [Athelia sp. TMB]
MATTTHSPAQIDDSAQKPEPIRININPRYYQVPGAAILVGSAIGIARGSRRAGLRFQAENAHRPPKTLQGWYYYKKTKNYRMMLGGLLQGGKTALQLGSTAIAWVGAEEGFNRCGLEDFREVGAGLVTSGVFSALYRLPWNVTRRTVALGLLVGGTMRVLRYAQGILTESADMQGAAVDLSEVGGGAQKEGAGGPRADTTASS